MLPDPTAAPPPDWKWLQHYPYWRTPDFEPVRPTTIPWAQHSPEHQEALRELWGLGRLRYKLDFEQQRVYDEFKDWYKRPLNGRDRRGTKRFSFDMSRRFGKSSTGLLIAFEERLRTTFDKRIVYWCATQEHAERILINEIFPWLTADCPPELRPTWERKRNRLVWRNDHKDLELCRKIEIAGFNNPDAPRGGSLYFGVVDEAGMISNLRYIDREVISPMLLGIDDSCILFISTPAPNPTHYWSSEIIPDTQRHGTWIRRTIFDNPRLSTEEIHQEIEGKGGIDDPTVQREYLARHIPDMNLTVLPEAQAHFDDGSLDLPPDYSPPKYRHCYVSLDPGWSDATGMLFGYVDYENQWLVVEDEWLENQAPSSDVAEACKDKEKDLWERAYYYSAREGKQPNPHRRWSDIDKRLVADLRYDHGLIFQFTEKDRLHNQINRVRNMILGNELKIHSRCKLLRRQMISGMFKNDQRREFRREDRFQHCDLLACLIYLCRGAWPLLRMNPFPPRMYNPQTHAMVPEPGYEKKTRFQHVQRTSRSDERVRRLRSKPRRAR